MDHIGIKRFLSRTLSIEEVKALSLKAHTAVLAGENQIAITSNGFDGASASGQLLASALDIGRICEEILTDAGEGATNYRNIFVRADMSYNTRE